MSNLRKTQKEEDEDSSDSSSSEEERNEDDVSSKTPVMNSSKIPHFGCINRIRVRKSNHQRFMP